MLIPQVGGSGIRAVVPEPAPTDRPFARVGLADASCGHLVAAVGLLCDRCGGLFAHRVDLGAGPGEALDALDVGPGGLHADPDAPLFGRPGESFGSVDERFELRVDPVAFPVGHLVGPVAFLYGCFVEPVAFPFGRLGGFGGLVADPNDDFVELRAERRVLV